MGESCRALLRDDAIAECGQLLFASEARDASHVSGLEAHEPFGERGGEAGEFAAWLRGFGCRASGDGRPVVHGSGVFVPCVQPYNVA